MRDGWILWSTIHNHFVRRAQPHYCAVCSGNKGRGTLLRKTRSVCQLCHFDLCTVLRYDRTELSYFKYWYQHENLSGRTCLSKSEQNRKGEGMREKVHAKTIHRELGKTKMYSQQLDHLESIVVRRLRSTKEGCENET